MKLNNGIEMPNVGIGTFLLSSEQCEESVYSALKVGYRMVDTANVYVNERAVGRAIKRSGLKRSEVFISTKLWPTEYNNPHAIEDTLARLSTTYIDLLFLHQPTSNWRDGYRQLVEAYKKGIVRSIGVSNFEGEFIKELIAEFDVIPQVIQVECHPFYPQDELRAFVGKYDIKIMSWYPLGGKGMTGELLNNPLVKAIANKYHKSSAQIILKWHTQMRFIVIPGSSNIDHIKDNIDINDFSLTQSDMDDIASLNSGTRRYIRSDESLKQFAQFKPNYEKN